MDVKRSSKNVNRGVGPKVLQRALAIYSQLSFSKASELVRDGAHDPRC